MAEALALGPWVLAYAAVVTAASALLQGTVGFGFAILAVPLLALVHPALAPVPQLLLSVPLTVAMAVRERHAMDLKGIWYILLGRVPGSLLGLALLKLASPRTLDALLAAMVFASVAALHAGVSVRRTPRTEFAAGAASGLAAVVSSIGGPPVALLYRDASGPTLRASLAAIFAIGVVMTAGFRLGFGELRAVEAWLALLLAPPLGLGLWLSRYTVARIEGVRLRRAVLAVSSAAALGLVVKACLR